MTVRLGPFAFEDVDYDTGFDILHLRAGDPEPTVGEDTDEGHVICFAESDRERVVGFDLFNVRATLEQQGSVPVTLPSGDTVTVEGIEAALGMAPQT